MYTCFTRPVKASVVGWSLVPRFDKDLTNTLRHWQSPHLLPLRFLQVAFMLPARLPVMSTPLKAWGPNNAAPFVPPSLSLGTSLAYNQQQTGHHCRAAVIFLMKGNIHYCLVNWCWSFYFAPWEVVSTERRIILVSASSWLLLRCVTFHCVAWQLVTQATTTLIPLRSDHCITLADRPRAPDEMVRLVINQLS